MAFSPDDERLYANGIEGICVLDARTLRTAQPVVLPNGPAYGVAAMSLSPDGRFVAGAMHNNAGAGMQNSVVVCDAVTGQSLQTLGHPDVNVSRIGRNGKYPTWVTAVAFTPDGKRVLTASRQYLSPMEWTPSQVALWDRASGKQVAHWELACAGENRGGRLPLDGTALPAAAIAFSPRGDRIVATGDFGQVWILDAQSLVAVRQWTAHDSTVFAVAVERDGRRLATAGADQMIRIWDLGTGDRLAVLPGHSGTVYDLAFSPDGRRLASASADGTVKIWNWAAFLPPD